MNFHETIKHVKTIEVYATLFIYDNIKFLIDKNYIVYHYTDRVPLGILDKTTNEVYFYYGTQEEYNLAIKNCNILVKRFLE